MSFDHHHYVPCLRWKQGEYQAVHQLPSAVKEIITSLPNLNESRRPDVPNLDWRLVKPAASIRYTADNAWYIVKGPNVRDNKFAQYRRHCKQVIASPHYCGPIFSAGDKYIADCAAEKANTGNLTTWRKVGTNHHLVKLAHDISNFSWPSSRS